MQDLIGKTPLVKLNHVELPEGVNLFAKLELFNPGGSVKDRIGKYMIEDAEKTGRLQKGGTIVEATAGNTGLGIAFAALNKGYKIIFVVPTKFSEEKQTLMRALGAEIINTPREGGMLGAAEKAEELRASISGAISLEQFKNQANPLAHYETTGPEIYNDLNGEIDYVVAGAGSGGTYTGVLRYLKEKDPAVRGILADPVGSTMGGGEHGDYNIEGIGNDFIADTMDMSLVDDVIRRQGAGPERRNLRGIFFRCGAFRSKKTCPSRSERQYSDHPAGPGRPVFQQGPVWTERKGLRSDDIIVGSQLTTAVKNILQGDAVQVICDDLVQPLPDREDGALTAERTVGIRFGGTGNRRKGAFCEPEDITDGVFIRSTGQLIAAQRAADSPEDPGVVKDGNDLLQVFLGYLLAVSNILERNISAVLVFGKIQKHTNGVKTFGRYSHGGSPFVYSEYYHTVSNSGFQWLNPEQGYRAIK